MSLFRRVVLLNPSPPTTSFIPFSLTPKFLSLLDCPLLKPTHHFAFLHSIPDDTFSSYLNCLHNSSIDHLLQVEASYNKVNPHTFTFQPHLSPFAHPFYKYSPSPSFSSSPIELSSQAINSFKHGVSNKQQHQTRKNKTEATRSCETDIIVVLSRGQSASFIGSKQRLYGVSALALFNAFRTFTQNNYVYQKQKVLLN